ncbi:MAG: cytochrome P450 [Acidimicrobiales bacterium]
MSDTIPPVGDFATDWDFNDPAWVNDPYPIWDDLRSRCPMAHSERFNEGMWLPLHFDDVAAIANDTETFSNAHHGIRRGGTVDRGGFPPINNDPPEHMPIRRAILPFFGPKRIQEWRADITADCEARASAIVARGAGDAAIDYAQHIPVGAIAAILGIDPADGDQFRAWIYGILAVGTDDAEAMQTSVAEVRAYMAEAMAERRQNPGSDLISHLVTTDIDGEPLADDMIERILVLQLVAGIDTTWSSIGAALWHLATHAEDRRRLVAEPELLPTAIEEFLRAYAPVNVARRVTKPAVVRGVDIEPGDHVMMAFPVACRDPEKFERADEVLIDRAQNRHIAFGVGIHRCLGSNLARLEMEISLATFLKHIPEFSLTPGTSVEWSTGQIRGPRSIPITVG